MIHELKINTEYFEAIADGTKPFEVRKEDDRVFGIGDYLALNEFTEHYTGRCMIVQVTYILDSKEYCKDGYVIMGISPCSIYTRRDSYAKPPTIPFYAAPIYGDNGMEEVR